MKKIFLLPLFLTALGACSKSSNPEVTEAPAVDNTGINERDVDSDALTAQEQAMGSDADVETTRKIRSSIVDDKALSTYAHNVKIVTLNGKVTLRGPVKSLAEKESLARHVRKYVPRGEINNLVDIDNSEQAR